MSDQQQLFDFQGFYRALDATRESRGLNWKQVAAEASVSPSTLTRMAQDRRPDADGLASLSAWAALNPADFVAYKSKSAAEPLAEISRILRSDPKLQRDDAAALEDIVRAAYARMQLRASSDETKQS